MILCVRASRPETNAGLAIALNQLRPVRGTLVLHPAADLFHATVIIQLFDTTFIDVAGTLIGRQQFHVTGLRVAALPFRVPVPVDLPRSRFSFSAEVRRSRGPTLASGDYVNTAATTWQPDITKNIEIDVRRID